MLRRLAAIGLVAGALIAAPAAATAATDDPYADRPDVTVDEPAIDACTTSTIAFGADYFIPGETVDVSVSGTGADRARVTGGTAEGDGSLVASFRPPSDGADAYAIRFTGAERSYTATITVRDGRDAADSCDHDPAVAAVSRDGSSDDGLAVTGGAVSPWALGAGAVALAAGGGLVVAGAVRRRRL